MAMVLEIQVETSDLHKNMRDIPQDRMRIGMMVLASALWLVFTGKSHAHQDPWGDIHPQVSVLDGKFAIVFNPMVPDQSDDYSEAKPVSRMIYNPDGTLFAPRHALEKRRDWREMGPAGIYGKSSRIGEDVLFFHGDQKPGYTLKSPDGNLTRVRLPWPEEVSLYLFEEVLVTSGGIAITGKQGGEDAGALYFYWFAHGETKAGTVVRIGPTACIYDFPVASNIAFAGDRFWVAYMAGEENLKLMLWSWKPGEKEGRAVALDSPAHWNSHLSLAAIGDRLCLAYHCAIPGSDGNPQRARILTVFRKAE